jgi:hypothetical protein
MRNARPGQSLVARAKFIPSVKTLCGREKRIKLQNQKFGEIVTTPH